MGSPLHEHGLGLERRKRKVGRKERRGMGARITKPSGEKGNLEAEVVNTQMQKRKVKRNWFSHCSSPLALGKQSQGFLPHLTPQP